MFVYILEIVCCFGLCQVQCIISEVQVLQVVVGLVVEFVWSVVECDWECILLFDQIECFLYSGLWVIIVLCFYGGIGVLWQMVVEVFWLIFVVDFFIGQIL